MRCQERLDLSLNLTLNNKKAMHSQTIQYLIHLGLIWYQNWVAVLSVYACVPPIVSDCTD